MAMDLRILDHPHFQINRWEAITFQFNGKSVPGYTGETTTGRKKRLLHLSRLSGQKMRQYPYTPGTASKLLLADDISKGCVLNRLNKVLEAKLRRN
jgi:hypothetical protein